MLVSNVLRAWQPALQVVGSGGVRTVSCAVALDRSAVGEQLQALDEQTSPTSTSCQQFMLRTESASVAGPDHSRDPIPPCPCPVQVASTPRTGGTRSPCDAGTPARRGMWMWVHICACMQPRACNHLSTAQGGEGPLSKGMARGPFGSGAVWLRMLELSWLRRHAESLM